MKPKMLLLVGVLMGSVSAFENVNSGMFGESLPEGTVVFAVDYGAGGDAYPTYTLYAVSNTLPISEMAEGESWAAYLERVNEEQGLPSRSLDWVVLNDEPVLRQIVPDESPAQTDGGLLEYKIGWGVVGNLRVVARVEEFSFLGTTGSGESTARIVSAVGYPNSDTNAFEMLEDRTVEVFPAPPPNSGDMFETLLGDSVIQVAYPGEFSSDIGEDGDQNDAGYQCMFDRNEKEQRCGRNHANNHMSCVKTHAGCHTAIIGVCGVVTAACPPCGLACAGAGMIGCSTVIGGCRNDADMVGDSCNRGARSAYQLCCAGEGVECPTQE